MPATHLTLVLNPSASGQGCAPNYEPWTPAPAGAPRSVAIYNASGHEQTLSNIDQGLLNPSPGGQIIIAAGSTWCGTVGNANGEYDYEDGSSKMVPRRGTINPG